jgi:hypothetical protein
LNDTAVLVVRDANDHRGFLLLHGIQRSR